MTEGDVKYLRELSEKLRRVPASYDVDGGDADRLLVISDELDDGRALLARSSEFVKNVRMAWVELPKLAPAAELSRDLTAALEGGEAS